MTLKIVDESKYNANINIQTKELQVGTGFLEELTNPQLKGLLGHEFGHGGLKQVIPSDFLLTTRKNRIALSIIFILGHILGYYILGLTHWYLLYVGLFAVSIILNIIFSRLVRIISIKDELNADYISALSTRNPDALLKATEHLETPKLQRIMQKTRGLRKIRNLNDWLELKWGLIQLNERKRQLEGYISFEKSLKKSL
ncbi:hypothetical protein CEE45_02075 [Candidatus Heimdallarchaeota archaeon B3_Heim]|nr:MAG: hypothetical protein CEE45_02075 [Candidatus Heimdallarchaeota archaeon B3_Heim]